MIKNLTLTVFSHSQNNHQNQRNHRRAHQMAKYQQNKVQNQIKQVQDSANRIINFIEDHIIYKNTQKTPTLAVNLRMFYLILFCGLTINNLSFL